MIRRLILTLILAGPVGWAQTHPSILVKPWPTGPLWAETRDEIVVQERANTRGGTDAGIWAWDSTGRIKFDRETTEPRWVLGYRILSLTVDSDLPAINGTFWDIALAAGGRVARLENEWEIYLLGGAGTANDGHFDDEEALYGIGTVHFARKLSADEEWMFGLSYDGHRSFLPDVPLPYVSYRRKVNDQLIGVVGLPFGGAYWRPLERLRVDVSYILPADWKGRVSWHFTGTLSVFAEYTRAQDGFSINAVDNRRLFYSARRAFGGIRWVNKLVDVSAGVGYAFDQEFETGFDLRDTRTVTRVEDAPFVMVRLEGTF